MRRLALGALALLACAGAAAWSPPPPRRYKPVAPIEIEASIVGDPAQPFGIRASARSRNGAPVDLEVVLPEGVSAVAGDTKARGARCDVRLDARAKDRSRREIFVRATMVEGSARLTRVVPLVLNDAPPAPAGTAAKSGRGEALVVFSP